MPFRRPTGSDYSSDQGDEPLNAQNLDILPHENLTALERLQIRRVLESELGGPWHLTDLEDGHIRYRHICRTPEEAEGLAERLRHRLATATIRVTPHESAASVRARAQQSMQEPDDRRTG